MLKLCLLVAYVRPSRQLLEFYRNKIVEYENEHEALIKKFMELKGSCQDPHQLECEMKQREAEIAELQKVLSDMQVFLFKEREGVLNLYQENDSFKVRFKCSVNTVACSSCLEPA